MQPIDHTMLELPIHYVLWIQIVSGTHIVADTGSCPIEVLMAIILEKFVYSGCC